MFQPCCKYALTNDGQQYMHAFDCKLGMCTAAVNSEQVSIASVLQQLYFFKSS